MHIAPLLSSVAIFSEQPTFLLFVLLTQVTGSMPTISIDKTNGCRVYLSEQAKDVDIITAMSTEVNILVPKNDGDFVS